MTLVLAIRIPIYTREFADVLDHRCQMRWAVDQLIILFSGSLIQHAVVISPGCNEFANSTVVSPSLDVELKEVGMNSAMIG